MAPPTADQVKVAIEALRQEAGVWDQEADTTGNIATAAEELRLNRIEAGLFQVIFDTYSQVIDQVIARANEGKTQMTEVADTLRSVADTYEQEEAANVHKLKNIY
ncbi:hypothetical protein LWC34_02080 [Kibdelosporangium philippinense]|uniref:Excreted virulence factor EspC, type VII ESX diderm n=1 Tax=Kibdelosporangium philippinense TaxID=211113 RepID=A0ABS8Z133_9PSEU|nr:type VII secretion target [Kibdelosporangium philippinense]MCE7001634.1 hypothetical protein [Kibdelosporangium philippinense]